MSLTFQQLVPLKERCEIEVSWGYDEKLFISDSSYDPVGNVLSPQRGQQAGKTSLQRCKHTTI